MTRPSLYMVSLVLGAYPLSNVISVSLPDPIIRIELVDTSCCTLDWANSEILAAGCTNG